MDTSSVNSVPSSTMSGSSSARSTPVPSHYKPLTQSASILALTKSSDEEMKRKNPEEILHILRRLEGENRNLVMEHSNIMKDVNKRMQILLLEVRGLKDINQTLQDDNQELRDLCCFLDDDRQRGRKLAREWQRFGRYTASVMRSEVSAYQEKLKELEQKQTELISDNVDLKELCLYLDQERMRASQTRDEGDGSSNSTLAGGEEPAVDADSGIDLVPVSQLQHSTGTGANEYVRHLEDKVKQLEEEKKNISQQLGRGTGNGQASSKDTSQIQGSGSQRLGPDGNHSQDGAQTGSNPNKPEAVVHAMKVLEVHENLERPITSVGEDNLDDKEKAIVREMCNVVWRKLGNVSSEGDSEQSTPHPVYENIQPGRSRSTPLEPNNKSGQDRPPDRYPQTHPAFQQDPGIGLEPMPVYTAHPVQPIQQGNRAEASMMGQSVGPAATRLQQDQYTSVPPSSHHSRSQPLQTHRQNHQNHYSTGDQQNPPQGQPPPPAPHHGNQNPKYGYVRTTRSTPVTPTPQQRSYSPHTQHPNQGSAPSRPYDPSPSPAPAHKHLMQNQSQQRSRSPAPQRSQYPRTDSQSSVHLYQNQTPLGGKGDNSYENVPHNYYYVTAAKDPNTMHESNQDSRSSSYPMGSKSIPGPSMPYNEQPSRHQSRTSSQSHPGPPPSSQSQYPSNSQAPPYYQNMHYSHPSATAQNKQKVRDPSPQGPRSQPSQAPPYRPPQHSAGSANYSQQPGPHYTQQYPARSTSVSSTQSMPGPHNQAVPGHYTGHQTGQGNYQGQQGSQGKYSGQLAGYMDYPEDRGVYQGRQEGRRAMRDNNNQYY